MSNELFRYKGVAFPYSPKSLSIRRERRLVRFFSPLSGGIVQDLGDAPAVVSGEGELFGGQAAAALAHITGLFELGGRGLLQLPGHPAMPAWFAALQTDEQAGPPVIRYRFTFIGGEEAAP